MVFRLPVIAPSLDRRGVLLLGVAGGVAACGPTANFGLIDKALPPGDDAGDPGVDPTDDAGVDPTDDAGDPGVDVETAPLDVGRPPIDVGAPPRDTGVVPPRDTGVVPPRDTGVVPPVDTGPSCTPTGTRVGTVASLPVGAFQVVGSGRSTVIVGHDAGGFYAFSGVCTHQGCSLGTPVGGTITCSCHHAQFDANGTVTAGPARTSLAHRAVTVCDGVLYLGTATVAASTRTPA